MTTGNREFLAFIRNRDQDETDKISSKTVEVYDLAEFEAHLKDQYDPEYWHLFEIWDLELDSVVLEGTIGSELQSA